MKKREFLKVTGALAAGTVISPFTSCNPPANSDSNDSTNETPVSFTQPKLNFAFNALEPNIDAQTMEIHYGKHHAGYVRKFNAALADAKISGKSLTDILGSLTDDGKTTGLRNNGGGHFNHSLFWDIMTPKGASAPSGDLADAINAAFGSFDKFKDLFSTAAKTRFGSGWAWLSKGTDGKLFVSSTPNQDNPLMKNLVEKTGTPILGIDVWEHAYYLKYQNLRGDYIKNFFKVIDWSKVGANLKR